MKAVWFAEIRGDYIQTRKQHLISELLKRHKVLYLEPFTLGHDRPFTLRTEGRQRILALPALRPSAFNVINRLLKSRLALGYFLLLHPLLSPWL